MVFATYILSRFALDRPGTDVMEKADPEGVPYMFRMDLKWYGMLTQYRVSRVIDKSSMFLVTAFCHQAQGQVLWRPSRNRRVTDRKKKESQILAEMIALDKERALTAMKS